jgi:putative membrane protein
MSIKKIMAGAASGLVIAFGAGHTTTLQAQEVSTARGADQQFINQVAAKNLLEVRLGQAAAKNGSSPAVKQFAQQMVSDHTFMQKLWMDLASKKDLDFEAKWSSEQAQQAERLRAMSGTEFDRAYMGLMVQNHAADVNTFQNELRVAHSTEVRDLITRDLSVLRNHLRQAQQIGRQVDADVSGGVATTATADTSVVITQNRRPADTTGVITQTRPQDDTGVITQTRPQGDTTVITQNRRQADTTGVITQTRGEDTVRVAQDRRNQQRDADRRRNDERATRGDAGADAEFIRDVNAGHLLEVRLGQLAQKKGRDAEVKRFGQRMEKDHAALLEQWSDLRSDYDMSPQSGMGPNHRAKLELLEKVSGKAFDRQYMRLMIQNHQDYLDYWRKEGRGARTGPVRQLVIRGIPTLEQHMEMAKRIGKQVGVDPDAALAGRRITAQRPGRPTVIK